MANWNESQLEQYVVDHMGELFAAIGTSIQPKLLGRQVICDNGIIDLLVQCTFTVVVIELKAVTANQKTVGQVQRYKHAIEYVCEFDGMSSEDFDAFAHEIYPDYQTMIVAPKMTRQAVMSVDHAILTAFTGQRFEFHQAGRPKPLQNGDSLNKVLEPYFAYLLTRAKQNRIEQSSMTLERHARKTASYIN